MDPSAKVQGRLRTRAAFLAGTAVTAAAFLVYLRTLAPTVLGFEPPTIFDSPMLQAEVSILGIGHPTGYPTYMMLTHLFTYLPIGDAAYRVNLASAVYAALAVALVYAIGVVLSRRVVAAAAGALAFALSPTFWSQAVVAEVYALNTLFVSLVIFALLLWRESRRDRYLLLAAFLCGLSLTHHLTSGLLVPAGLLFVFLVDRGKLRNLSLLLKGAGLFLLALLPYAYLPIRAMMGTPLNEADPSTIERFLLLVTGGSFALKNLRDARTGGGASGAAGSEDSAGRLQGVLDGLLSRLPEYWGHLSEQFPVVLMLVGALGALYLISTDRAATTLLGVPFVGSLLHGLLYGFEDFFIFLIPAYLVFGLFVTVGLGALMRGAENLVAERFATVPRMALLLALSALVLATPLLGVRETYAQQDHSRDYSGRRAVEAVANNVEPGATVLHHRSALWYMVLVEQRRRDLTLIDPFETSWVRHQDIVWPDPLDAAESAARYKTDDVTGVETARVAAEDGPVYVLDPEGKYLAGFRETGFEVADVNDEAGLYELVPSDDAQASRVLARR
jgi:4-amino-4-deoxy-L-arabinose transferase-like glycosyltransferase